MKLFSIQNLKDDVFMSFFTYMSFDFIIFIQHDFQFIFEFLKCKLSFNGYFYYSLILYFYHKWIYLSVSEFVT